MTILENFCTPYWPIINCISLCKIKTFKIVKQSHRIKETTVEFYKKNINIILLPLIPQIYSICCPHLLICNVNNCLNLQCSIICIWLNMLKVNLKSFVQQVEEHSGLNWKSQNNSWKKIGFLKEYFFNSLNKFNRFNKSVELKFTPHKHIQAIQSKGNSLLPKILE